MKTTIKVLRGILTGLLLAVIAVNLWLAVQKLAFHKDPPEILGFSQLVVASGSMEPSFSAGDVVIIQRSAQYQPGEVVTFRSLSGELITHRIIGTTEGKFITKGDANNTEDGELLSADQIVGKMVTYLPAVGTVLLFFNTPLGLTLLLFLGVLLIEFPRITGAFRKRGKGRHANDGT